MTTTSRTMNDTAEVRQVGNLFPDTEGFRNKTSGRVYSADGIAPTLNIAEGGAELPTSSRLIAQIPLNADKDGCAPTIKAGYYKMGGANFLGHPDDGLKAMCIIEVYEDE